MGNMYESMPKEVADQEMKSATEEVTIIEMIDAAGNKVKKLKPIFIKSEPDKEYVQKKAPLPEDKLPPVPEHFFQREKCFEQDLLTDQDESNDTRSTEESTVTDVDPAQMEKALNSIALGLRQAAEGYDVIAKAVKQMEPYEIAGVVKQLPAPAVNVPRELQIAMKEDGPEKVVNRLLYAEHKRDNASYTSLQTKYQISRGKVEYAVKGTKRKGGSNKKQAKKMKDEPSTSYQ